MCVAKKCHVFPLLDIISMHIGRYLKDSPPSELPASEAPARLSRSSQASGAGATN